MKLSANGIAFLKAREGFRANAYSDGTKYTIGYGNTYWEDGSPVKAGQTITEARAEKLFKAILAEFERDVSKLVSATLKQSQFDALVSYAYNRGVYRFAQTTLLEMVNANPNNPAIAEQFVKEWGTNTTYKTGLINRRRLEAQLYFGGSGGTILASGAKATTWLLGLGLVGILLTKK